VISGVVPDSGDGGDSVTVSGSGFDPTTVNDEVCVGLGNANILSAASDSLSLLVQISIGATTGRVKVTVSFLEAYSPNPFTVGPACLAAKGDMNGVGGLTPADVVLMLTCVFSATGNCDLCFADVNCSGGLSPADVVIELNMVFLSAAPGC
ncbi:MAG: IPT/TIG domain-containing protein, partial [Limisphaerales bacterium]